MKIVDPKFPGMEGLGEEFVVHDEWYAFHKFNKDLHVILVQETKNMEGPAYQRPPYPATWARMQGKGRVFYTSMGHSDIWTNETFHKVLKGGIAWALKNVDVDVTPNIDQVTPGANDLPKTN
jgi:type 1 glutamine amidotransferase